MNIIKDILTLLSLYFVLTAVETKFKSFQSKSMFLVNYDIVGKSSMILAFIHFTYYTNLYLTKL